MNYILISTEPSWGHASGLDAMLRGLGLRRGAPDAGASLPARLVLVDCRGVSGDAILTLNRPMRHDGRVRITIVPSDADVSILEELLPHFDDVLTAPVDEVDLCKLLAAYQYDAVSPEEHALLGTKLLALACDDPVMAERLLGMILDTNRSTLATMRHTFELEQWEQLASAAHRVAGSSRMLDCDSLTALLTRLETTARERRSELAGAILAIVIVSLQRLDASLKTVLRDAVQLN